jgi:hypothetical protein
MLPRLKDAFITVDVPNSRAKFHLKYLLDEDQVEFLSLYNGVQELQKRSRGKKANAISEAVQAEPEKWVPFIDRWINLFLCGWSGEDVKDIPFPKKPSSLFMFTDKFDVFALIQDNLSELVGLKEDNKKNS